MIFRLVIMTGVMRRSTGRRTPLWLKNVLRGNTARGVALVEYCIGYEVIGDVVLDIYIRGWGGANAA
jgi:hypothetical protein